MDLVAVDTMVPINGEKAFNRLIGPDHRRYCTYRLGYNVAVWMKGLPGDVLKKLQETGWAEWEGPSTWHWKFRYIPGRQFTVWGKGKCAQVFDLSPWYRVPFSDALAKWHSGNLAGLWESTWAVLQDIGLSAPTPFPGSSAAKLIRKHTKGRWLEVPDEAEDAVSRAYFGGWVQAFQLGAMGDCWKYDLRSAYGWGLSRLPGACDWVPINPSEGGWALDDCLLRVRWLCEKRRGNTDWEYWAPPFPYRDDEGTVCYPPVGEGWHWSPVVWAAMRMPGVKVEVLEGWRIARRDTHDRPFRFVEDLHRLRMEMKEAGHPGADLVKLVTVAIYGKLCQSKSGQSLKNLAWAGLATAHIRAEMIDAARASGMEDTIACLTDCLITRNAQPPGPLDDRLGGWSEEFLREVNVWGPINYAHTDGFGRWKPHLAGVPDATEETVRAFIREWERAGISGDVPVGYDAFFGLGAASRAGWDTLGTWRECWKSIRLRPSSGYPSANGQWLSWRPGDNYSLSGRHDAKGEGMLSDIAADCAEWEAESAEA